jgi:hypothetical protein
MYYLEESVSRANQGNACPKGDNIFDPLYQYYFGPCSMSEALQTGLFITFRGVAVPPPSDNWLSLYIFFYYFRCVCDGWNGSMDFFNVKTNT